MRAAVRLRLTWFIGARDSGPFGAKQKLLVPLGASDRTLDNPEDAPSRQRSPPSAYALAYLGVNSRVAHHAFVADLARPSLELRFDQRDGPGPVGA